MTLLLILGTILVIPQPISAQAHDSSPPAEIVKLIFTHHSCGENWLADDHGGLGRALAENNYFVSDTNYGWGPDSIGDRTDITDWPEWFTDPNSDRYLVALYAESGQNSWYTRDLPDPGGENQIIMFKSCFPNSNLEGSPNDPPVRGEGLTVSNAKAIYNELLTYFATRPDKLFVVITAPPVQDPTHAANARAFNTWLVIEWLNGYEGSNVAVFDFYNLLTDPDNHHRFHSGAIEHITNRGGDTLYYPSNGDDHPSPAGNRKATEEFVPLLNVYYHRWRSGAPVAPPPARQPTPVPPTAMPQPAPVPSLISEGETPAIDPLPPPSEAGEVIDDFERGVNEWVVFADEEKDTELTCGRDEADSHSGAAGLRIEYDIASDSWATCSLVYPSPQDWGEGLGLTVRLHAERVGQQVTLVAYQGNSPDSLSHFEFQMQTDQEAVAGWQRVDVPWNQLTQPSWEGNGTARFDPNRAMGLAFLFDAPDGRRNSGQLWVDNVSLLSAVPPASATPELAVHPQPSVISENETSVPQPADESEREKGRKGLCPGSTAIGLVTLIGVIWARRQPSFLKEQK
ncbi:MAG: hypothetical protein ISS52_03125 [Dehalococcoidia bacterium]|nr:hypothetical protein [Dehalococcoidia bacterium]